MTIDDFNHIPLPDSPGVYFFKKGKTILYIGKATSLADRVRSYFSHDLIRTRGMFLVDMVTKADTITYEETSSVLEALLLESELIKKYTPHYNTKEKDDKSYPYIAITKETYPTVLLVRGRDIKEKDAHTYEHLFGPFTSTQQMKEALNIIRKIFPYKDERCVALSGKQCFNASIGLCPGVCVGAISVQEYKKTIQKLVLFLSGNTKKVIALLTKDMHVCAKQLRFEDAEKVKRKIYALTHIHDISLLKKERTVPIGLKKDISITETQEEDTYLHSGALVQKHMRIEAYDVAHMQGKSMVGVFVVLIDGEFEKQEYRKFILKTVKSSNDPAALKEILTRRFTHPEWNFPDVIVVDGNEVQQHVATAVLQELVSTGVVSHMPYIVSVVKDEKHIARDVLYVSATDKEQLETRGVSQSDIYMINAEAHRVAIAFFRKKQRKDVYL